MIPKGMVETDKFVLRGFEPINLDLVMKRSERNVRRRTKGVISVDADRLEKIPRRLLNELSHQMNILTVRSKVDGWMSNMKSNLPGIVGACASQVVRNGIEGPCIVAGGSNPSTPLIRKQLKLLITPPCPVVACDRAFSFLAKGRWAPEYAVVLENNRDPNYDFLLGDGRRRLTKDSTLYASIITHPDILADWRGDIVLYRHSFPDEIVNLTNICDFLFERLPTFWHGGNVGTCAYAIALFLRANPVALVGMDFGVETGYVHPRKGRQFVTDPLLMAYAKAFSTIIKVASEQGILTYNCTGGGVLRDEWIPEKPLADFLLEAS